FFQAVALLEQLLPDRAAVGEFAEPSDEVVRFRTPATVGFPASAIQALEEPTDDDQARMTVNFMGLVGPQSTLPLDYTLYAAGRIRAGDRALKDFLGIFEHRMISLFYRAWVRSHAVVRHADGTDRDWLTKYMLNVVGLGTPGLQGRLPVPDEALVYFGGLLSLPSRPAAALEQLVSDYWGVPVEVKQFVGAWYPLERRAQTALGENSSFGDAAGPAEGGLGFGAVAGDEVWDQQGRIRLRIGPLTRGQYDRFLPGGDAHEALRALTRFFGNDQFDFEAQLVLAREEAPQCRLDADDAPLALGWGTWLRTAPLDRDPDDTVVSLQGAL
ncbi:MAG: type VI secretion system baseplate subunit TssG, partial [Gemmatimonadaceae bacterium]